MWGRSVRRAVAVSVPVVLLVTACTGGDDGPGVPDRPSRPTSPATSDQSGPTAPADPARSGWVVTLGDSYISGEGARWGANGGPVRRTDALGPNAYFDRRGQESEPGCHRASRTVAVPHVAGLRGRNFACSGATTRSDSSGLRFKPGIDFAHEADGDGLGQALSLRRFAGTHRVTAVVVSIGGNDFGFGAIAGRCVTDNLASAGGARQLCSDDADLVDRFSASSRRQVQRHVTDALSRVSQAMVQAGYAADDYRRIVATYPSPVPPGDRLRSTGSVRDRLGCPLSGRDATWADDVALPAINQTVTQAAFRAAEPFEVVDLSAAFDGHRLCETGTARLSETSLSSWRAPGAVDQVEWVNQVYRTLAPHQVQESLHPNVWGTAAERACLRLVLTGPVRPLRACTQRRPGLRHGDPVMELE